MNLRLVIFFPFGGNDAFTDETTPASQTYQGGGA